MNATMSRRPSSPTPKMRRLRQLAVTGATEPEAIPDARLALPGPSLLSRSRLPCLTPYVPGKEQTRAWWGRDAVNVELPWRKRYRARASDDGRDG